MMPGAAVTLQIGTNSTSGHMNTSCFIYHKLAVRLSHYGRLD